MGAKRIDVETLSAKWELCMSRLLGRKHPEILLRLRPISLSVSLTDLSVVAEPGSGSGVPSFSRQLLALSLSASMDMTVVFLPPSAAAAHPAGGGGGSKTTAAAAARAATGRWECKSFDFAVDEISRSAGLTLPSGLLQWIINSFVPPKVKQAVVESLPPELALLIDRSNNVKFSGELGLFGLPAAIMDCPLKLGKSLSAKDSVRSMSAGDRRDSDVGDKGSGDRGGGGGGKEELPAPLHVDPRDAAHRSALRLLSAEGGRSRSSVSALQGHVLAKLRRRSGLASELKSLTDIFSMCSKWGSIAHMAAYVRAVDAWGYNDHSSSNNDDDGGDDDDYSSTKSIISLWERMFDSFCAADGLDGVDLQRVFARVRKISAQPLQITFALTEVSMQCELGKFIDAMRTISLRSLEKEHESLREQK